mmetsp:Transcript_20289/g.51916  ORF Transcript_20289/g.51916 Transcript_20289/m.51916 type:complete len:140 (+) Transcript_20289:6342-6761(+)
MSEFFSTCDHIELTLNKIERKLYRDACLPQIAEAMPTKADEDVHQAALSVERHLQAVHLTLLKGQPRKAHLTLVRLQQPLRDLDKALTPNRWGVPGAKLAVAVEQSLALIKEELKRQANEELTEVEVSDVEDEYIFPLD